LEDIWYYNCKLCGANEEKRISDFMRDHAHGIRSDMLPKCSIVKHRSEGIINRVTIKLPAGLKKKDAEYGGQSRGAIRIWFTGASIN